MVPIRVKRAYAPVTKRDGKRYLVDRIWPRGVKKDTLSIEAWLKELGPSNELRKWFGHDPARWAEFKKRVLQGARAQKDLWGPIPSAAQARRNPRLQRTGRRAQPGGGVARVPRIEVKSPHADFLKLFGGALV